MPKFAYLTDQHAARIAVNPAAVRFVREPASKRELVHIELTEGRVSVSTPFDEVMQILESVGEPPAAAPVVVQPTDLERAADVLDLLSMACEHQRDAWDDLDIIAVDRAIGVNSPEIHDTRDALSALATKLRGLAR